MRAGRKRDDYDELLSRERTAEPAVTPSEEQEFGPFPPGFFPGVASAIIAIVMRAERRGYL